MSSETKHLNLLNASGLPFQLAIEKHLRSFIAAGEQALYRVDGEVPWRVGEQDGFLDIVALRAVNTAPCVAALVIECKRVKPSDQWVFYATRTNETRCRLEWFQEYVKPVELGRFHCAEWNLVEPSAESPLCVIPHAKGEPSLMLEQISRQTLRGARGLFHHREFSTLGPMTVLVPIVVTNAELLTCELDPDDIDRDTGEVGRATFTPASIVRFRKTLATYGTGERQQPAQWVATRERTVFVMRPPAIRSFLAGFRSFTYAGRDRKHPPEFDPSVFPGKHGGY